jgi:hypothetical protein
MAFSKGPGGMIIAPFGKQLSKYLNVLIEKMRFWVLGSDLQWGYVIYRVTRVKRRG